MTLAQWQEVRGQILLDSGHVECPIVIVPQNSDPPVCISRRIPNNASMDRELPNVREDGPTVEEPPLPTSVQ